MEIKTHPFSIITIALCLAGILITNESQAQAARLLLVNDQETEVPSSVISVRENLIYDALGIPVGSPVLVTKEDGEILPASPGKNGKDIRIWSGLEASGSLEAIISPAQKWQEANDLIFARENPKELTATISNGLLTAVYQDEVFCIYLGSAAQPEEMAPENLILEQFSLHRSLSADASDVHEYRKEISPEGWTRAFRSDAPPVDVEASIEDGRAQITITHLFIHEEAQAIQYREILTLLPGEPIIDYRSVFLNEGKETFFLGSRNNAFTTIIRGLYDEDMQVVRANGRLVNEGRLGWFKPRWFSAVTKHGYSLGFTALEPGIPGNYYFDFHRANISVRDGQRIVKFSQAGVNNGAADAEKWAIFKPGEEEQIGVGVHVFIPGQAARKNMKKNWTGLASEQSMHIPSPLSVYLNGKAIQGGSITSAPDAFAQEGSWLPSGLSIEQDELSTLLKASRKEGTISRAFHADLDKPFVIRGSLESLSSDASLSFTVREIAAGETAAKAEITKARDLDFLLQDLVPWTGMTSFVLEFHLKGKRKCGAKLGKILLGEPPPEAPKLISPFDGVSLTDISEFYTWYEVKGCGEYDIEISDSPDFLDAQRQRVVMTRDKPYYYPREVLKPGTWYWRVRALQYDRHSTPGSWSETRHFAINDDHSVREPIIEISSKTPLISMRGDNWNSRHAIWEALDETIRPCFTFRAYPNEGDFFKNLEIFKEEGMQVLYEGMKPYSPTGNTTSLADVEYAYQNYPQMIGSCLGEEFYWYWDDEIGREYFERQHILAAKYGRVFHWSDLHKLGWNELAKRPEYASGDMAAVILPLLKTTEPYTAYITQGHLAGWYLAGLADNTGTQADVWYWASLGYKKCGENNFGVRQGYHRLIPPVTYLQHWILGMMQGGAVFANEWGGIANREGPNELWTRYYTPFFKGIIEHQLIPTREEYASSCKVIVKGDLPEDLPDVERWGFNTPDYGHFTTLYTELYGAKDAIKDFIPKKGRYGLIAVLPESVDDFRQEGTKVVSLDDLQSPEEVHAVFDPLYPENYSGDALVLQIGKTIAILNSNENLDVDQHYEIPFKGNKLVKNMKGDICVHKYIMGKHENAGRRLWLQANVSIVSPEKSIFPSEKTVKEGSYETRPTEITFECSEEPVLSWEPAEAEVHSSWDARKKLFHVILSHEDGAVSISLESKSAE